jgi:hypothetical protein
MRNKIIGLFTALALALGVGVASAPSASAVTMYNAVCNSANSANKVLVKNNGGTIFQVPPGKCSGAMGAYNIQGFYIFPNDSARSQWGYTYLGGRWIYFTNHANTLILTVTRIYV